MSKFRAKSRSLQKGGTAVPRGRRVESADGAGTSAGGKKVAGVKNSAFSNTMITITDAQGNQISWSSAGAMGLKVSRKSAPLPARSYESDGVLDQPLAAARERGKSRVTEILSAPEMLSADEMAKFLGTTRMTVNTKRRAHRLLGLEGAKRGVRYPRWQIGEDGKPFEILPALFDRLGGSPWAVYRFLVQHHAELDGLTGREALERGRAAQALEAAESIAAGAFS